MRDSPRPASPQKFSPGVRINWAQRVVEVDGVVVLREGPLELLACSPNTREHESILMVAARPRDIYQAMGLVGLEPGAPLRYDQARKRWFPPTGERLRIHVRYHDRIGEKTVPVEEWLVASKDHRSPDTLDWVFAGARILPGGVYTADLEGTIICVVDFETALIAPGSLHTADNELLWLAANTQAIPPMGTPVVLVIGSAAGGAIEIRVAADGTLLRDGQSLSATDAARLASAGEADLENIALVLRASRAVPEAVIRSALDSLVRAGLPRSVIKVRRDEPTVPTQPSGTAPVDSGG